MRKNKTFGNGGPVWTLAAVGNNGDPSYYEYARGYSDAANLLIDQILISKGKHPADTLVYPICFNMRHSVELRLKHTVINLKRVAEIKDIKLDIKILGSHDIGNLWEFITIEACKLDKRYLYYIDKLNEYIIDIADIDPNGQTFRYPYDLDSKKHLTEVAIISLLLVKKRLSELEKIMVELFEFNEYLVDEYSTRTFTTHLSRADLFEISKLLPPKYQWDYPAFDETRLAIREKFKISGNELSIAIDLIKNNYETAALIMAPRQLVNIALEDFYIFFDEWFKLHNLLAEKSTIEKPVELDIDSHSNIEEAMVLEKTSKTSAESISVKLSSEQISVLKALYEFSGMWKFSESFDFILEAMSKRISKGEYTVTSLRQDITHLLRKPRALDAILQSLYFLGAIEMANLIVEKYKLTHHLKWHELALNRALFKKPDWWGYKV